MINVSAATARTSMPYLSMISSTKAALESVSNAVRIELARWDVPVSVVRPGTVRTAIFGKAETAARRALVQMDPEVVELYRTGLGAIERAAASQRMAPPDRTVKTLVKAIEARRPKPTYHASMDARIGVMLSRLPTRLRGRVISAVLGLRRAAVQEGAAAGGAR